MTRLGLFFQFSSANWSTGGGPPGLRS